MATFVPASLHEPPQADDNSTEGAGDGSAVDPLHVDVGHRFGNFPNYYAFHSVSDRLDELTETMLEQWVAEARPSKDGSRIFNMVDVGCNDGTLTQVLHEKVSHVASQLTAREGADETRSAIQVRTLGLELDPALVARANARVETSSSNSDSVLSYAAVDCTDESLVAAAVAAFLGPECTRFDLVTCWSTTMWVHVNHGDAVHAAFIERLARLSHRLVVEPQPWRCYRAAATRLRRQGRPELRCYEDVSNRSEKLMEELTIRLICGTGKRESNQGQDGEVGHGHFTCKELSNAAGSWKRKVLLFERHE
jgi:2-polyprenyl-3-methyl-5-hydroxy-6-metoxy-1,4-benzoquinol methylase